MRAADTFTESSFTLHRLEDLALSDHLLRSVCHRVNETLVKMNVLLAEMPEAAGTGGRASIASEKLLRAMAL